MIKKLSAPTVADVARIAGVGAITVSRVVNGNGYVSAEKQALVRQAILELGYRPNQAARILKGSKAHMIGLIVPDLSDRFFGLCASAVERYAISQGYVTLIVTSQKKHDIEKNEIEMMMSQNIAGLIIVPTGSCNHLKQVIRRGVPIVAIDRPIGDVLTEEVVVENLGGARTAVEHLIEHGHRRIACIGYDEAYFTIQNRIKGYEVAMQAAQLQPQIHTTAHIVQTAFRLVERWKSSPNERPTALFSLNNVTTICLLEATQKASLRIPEEIAIIGFDDFEMAPLLSPPITTVRQPASDLGEAAAKILFTSIHAENGAKKLTQSQRTVLPVTLIIRGSCGCLPNQSALSTGDPSPAYPR